MEKKNGPASGGIGRRVLLMVAVLLPAVPLFEWAQEAFMVFRVSDHLPTLLMYYPARALALLGFVLMFYQFVLGVRLPLLERYFKRADTIKRHRVLGKIGFLSILLHGLLMLSYETWMSGMLYLDLPRVLGLVALLLLTVAVLAAWFAKPLKLSRKAWLRLHTLGYLVFPLSFFHASLLSTTMAVSASVRLLFYTLIGLYAVIVVYRVRGALVKTSR